MTISGYSRAKPGGTKKTVRVKGHKRLIKRMPMKKVRQTERGKAADKHRKAIGPGRRWNKSHTRKYTERRSNRSD